MITLQNVLQNGFLWYLSAKDVLPPNANYETYIFQCFEVVVLGFPTLKSSR